MADTYFIVRRVRGSDWDPALPMERQADWEGHRGFMNGLAAEGFVILGGPLEGTPEILLVVRAAEEEAVRLRLAADPWSENLLRIESVQPWTVRIGSLETPDPALPKWQRWFAVECNNLAWRLADAPTRTPEERDRMLHAAHAAALFWSEVGTELHGARAGMLLGHAHARAGDATLALSHAEKSFTYFSGHECLDWEIAFAHAVLAHAACAAGEHKRHATHHAEALRLGQKIADPEDRAIFDTFFQGLPEPASAGRS